MVFPSIPAYLDPANWQQQPNYQAGGSGSNSQIPPPPPHPQVPPPRSQTHVGGGGGTGSIRSGSMADRARMANIPMPETPQKCPRCESTNTKFCYFNNYSLSQPRHFCKTCRRYWTRGGALRSVPVGGGCRRNKRSKGSSSKSPASSGDRQTASGSTSTVPSNTGTTANILGLTSQIPQLRFMAPLSSQFTDYGAGEIVYNYPGISPPVVATSEMNFPIGTNFLGAGGSGGSVLTTGGFEQWRLQQAQQYPFLSGLDPSPGLYPFQGVGETSGYVGSKLSTSMLSQVASVKIEDNQGSNLSRLLGVPGNDPWSGTPWTDLSGFSSSSTSNPL